MNDYDSRWEEAREFDPWDAGRKGSEAIFGAITFADFSLDGAEGSGPRRINPDRIDDLASVLQACIADVVAGLIDAGSERDAVMESEGLHHAIATELKEWT